MILTQDFTEYDWAALRRKLQKEKIPLLKQAKLAGERGEEVKCCFGHYAFMGARGHGYTRNRKIRENSMPNRATDGDACWQVVSAACPFTEAAACW